MTENTIRLTAEETRGLSSTLYIVRKSKARIAVV